MIAATSLLSFVDKQGKIPNLLMFTVDIRFKVALKVKRWEIIGLR